MSSQSLLESRLLVSLLLLSSSLVLVIPSAQASSSSTDLFWTTGTPIPTVRSEIAGAALNNKIYINSGFDETGGSSSTVEAYDPSIHDSDFDGKIANVIDGDTLDVRTNGGNLVTIRLALVDAPETNELGYNEAKDFISQNCLDKPATVDPDNNQDLSYGRLVALVYCDGININEAIIAAGFASTYKSFCGVSEFGISDWAQKYGCAAEDGDLAGLGEDTNIDSDEGQEKISDNCDSAYSDVCITSPPPDLDCGDILDRNFKVKSPDPHNFDGDSDGIGCET
jgi:micrococcal nuclease